MAAASPPSRLRFNLRSLFVLTTLVAVLTGWQVTTVRERKAALASAIQNGALADAKAHPIFFRRWLGDVTVTVFIVTWGKETRGEIDRLLRAFPEAQVNWFDEHGNETVL
jgi:hypothetical protein